MCNTALVTLQIDASFRQLKLIQSKYDISREAQSLRQKKTDPHIFDSYRKRANFHPLDLKNSEFTAFFLLFVRVSEFISVSFGK